MFSKPAATILLILTLAIPATNACAQENRMKEVARYRSPDTVVSIHPNYVPPRELLEFLGAQAIGAATTYRWQTAAGKHSVEIHVHDAANLIIVSGTPADVAHVENLIHAADIPPRQIEIEVRIVEVSTAKTRDLGIDWDNTLRRANTQLSYDYLNDDRNVDSRDVQDRLTRQTVTQVQDGVTQSRTNTSEDYTSRLDGQDDDIARSTWQLGIDVRDFSQTLKILDECGAATIRNAPRVLTLNNRRATILDGQRVTYVTRYSAYSNLYETDTMDAGLNLTVLPSLGESGYMTLRIAAELTALSRSSAISDSPVKDGQIIENTVICRDGQSVLLGGLTRTIDETSTKRFPVLGRILPFLFSRDYKYHDEIERYVVLTPRVVDLDAALDDHTREVIEGN